MPTHKSCDHCGAPPFWKPGDTIDEALFLIVLAALRHYRWNQTKTAEALGVNRRTIQRYIPKLKALGLLNRRWHKPRVPPLIYSKDEL